MVNKKLGKICMIGMPGSGKSTIGRALSDHLKFNFYDTDEQIELESKSRIKDIFINENTIYVSYTDKEKTNCYDLKIISANLES